MSPLSALAAHQDSEPSDPHEGFVLSSGLLRAASWASRLPRSGSFKELRTPSSTESGEAGSGSWVGEAGSDWCVG